MQKIEKIEIENVGLYSVFFHFLTNVSLLLASYILNVISGLQIPSCGLMLRTVSAPWTTSPLRYWSYSRWMYLGAERRRPRPAALNLDGSTSAADRRPLPPRRRSTSLSSTPIMLPTTRRSFDCCMSSCPPSRLAREDATEICNGSRTSKKTSPINVGLCMILVHALQSRII